MKDQVISTLNKCHEYMDSLDMIINTLSNDSTNIKKNVLTIDKNVYNINLQFELLMKKMDTELEIFKEQAAITNNMISILEQKTNLILNNILIMDTNSKENLLLKQDLLQTVNKWTDFMAQIVFKMINK